MKRESSQRGRVDLERFAMIVDAYGAEPSAWPDDERDDALALLATSEAAVRLRDEAAVLDSLLDDAPVLEPPAALKSRILERAPKPAVSWADRVDRLAEIAWPFGPRWQPVAALAAAAVLGVLVGVAVPQASQAEASSTDITELAFGPDVDWSEAP